MAAAVIWSAYWGYCFAICWAPANDFCSCASTPLVTLSFCGEAATAAAMAAAYPAVSSAPRIDCMMAPPRSRCRSAVPDAMPARRTGTEPVSECEAGVPAKPTPTPTNAYPSPTSQ